MKKDYKKEIYLNQEELKKFSDAFKCFYDKSGASYPDDYYGYWCGWEYRGKFYVGTPNKGDEFVKMFEPVWNFPIVKQSDYPDLELKNVIIE